MLYRRLYDVYLVVKDSPRLSGVAQTYGPPAAGPISGPCIEWTPAGHTIRPGLISAAGTILDGKEVQIESPLTRWARCELRVTVEAPGEQVYEVMEDMLNSVYMALWDTLLSRKDIEFQESPPMRRTSLQDGPMMCLVPILVAIPIIDTLPTAPCANVSSLPRRPLYTT